MIKLKNLIIISITVLLISCNTNSNKNIYLDSLFSEQSLKQSNTGIAVGIIKDGKIVYSKGFGYANIETKDTTTDKTLFHLGSIPKSFVSIAIMQLVEKEKICLDSLLIKYIPELSFTDPRYKKITIRHLANHSSGIYSYSNHDYDKPKIEDDALDKFVLSLDYKELKFNPGEKFKYSDTNYDILGDVIYRVTGIPFEDYMKLNVLDKTEMYESTFFLPDTNKLARPYIDNFNEYKITRGYLYPVNREHAPDGSLFSNVNEMCNWITMNIQRGTYNSNKVVSESSHKDIWTKSNNIGRETLLSKSMGIGWFIGEIERKKVYSHSGMDHGYRAIYCVIPEDKFGVVILSNYQETPINYLMNNTLAYFYKITKIPINDLYPLKEEYKNIVGLYKFEEEPVKIYQLDNKLFAKRYSDSCEIFATREGGIVGKLYDNNWPFYYDQANIRVSKEFDSLKNISYNVILFNNTLEKIE